MTITYAPEVPKCQHLSPEHFDILLRPCCYSECKTNRITQNRSYPSFINMSGDLPVSAEEEILLLAKTFGETSRNMWCEAKSLSIRAALYMRVHEMGRLDHWYWHT